MSDTSAHALFSPSSAHKWIRCAGALAMEYGLPNKTSGAAEDGTAKHEVAAWALTDGTYYAAAYIGRITSNGYEVTNAMAEIVQTYVDAIRARVDEFYAACAKNVILLIEQRVDFSAVVGVPNQFGTSDAVFLVEWQDETWTVGVEDAKFGYNLVHADQNEQLMLYALGVLANYDVLGDFTNSRMVIHQPAREHTSDWELPVDELLAFGEEAKAAAQRALVYLNDRKAGKKVPLEALTPGEKQCQYCKAAGSCPALGKFVEETVGAEFEDLTKETVTSTLSSLSELDAITHGKVLARYMAAIPLIDIFSRAVMAATEAFMFDGGKVPGWKIVQGKKGNRSWGQNKPDAEAAMKAMRLKQEQMYDFTLISPTSAEKLLAKESPRRWAKLQKLVTQSDGKPAVVEESDKRPPLEIKPAADDFGVLADGDDLV